MPVPSDIVESWRDLMRCVIIRKTNNYDVFILIGDDGL